MCPMCPLCIMWTALLITSVMRNRPDHETELSAVEDDVATAPLGHPSAMHAATYSAPDSALPQQPSPADVAEAEDTVDTLDAATSSAAQSVHAPLKAADPLSSDCTACSFACIFDMNRLICLLHTMLPSEHSCGRITHIHSWMSDCLKHGLPTVPSATVGVIYMMHLSCRLYVQPSCRVTAHGCIYIATKCQSLHFLMCSHHDQAEHVLHRCLWSPLHPNPSSSSSNSNSRRRRQH